MALIVLDQEVSEGTVPFVQKGNLTAQRGVPKSGRVWKNTIQRKRHSANVNVNIPGVRTSWEKKASMKKERRLQKLEEQKLIDQKLAEKKAKKLEMQEAKKKKLENERRGEVVQPITDTRKLKKLSKKQWRQIRKGDATKAERIVKG